VKIAWGRGAQPMMLAVPNPARALGLRIYAPAPPIEAVDCGPAMFRRPC